MEYLHWKEEVLDNPTPDTISRMYDNGYVFTRIGKDVMHQTRSARIDLSAFELSSENRRILRKGESVMMDMHVIPFSKYNWEIGKVAKDFYDVKAPGSFSVNKIRELLTTNHNFNTLITYTNSGYAICYENTDILHYCYPFYTLNTEIKDMGLIMMTKAIAEAKVRGLKYVYLGSLQRSSDVYKLQFDGIEWFDGEKWKKDTEEVKRLLLE